MKQDFCEWQHQVEDQPDIHHLDVGGFGQLVGYINEHCCEHLPSRQFVPKLPRTLEIDKLKELTSITVRFTDTTASKKNALKKF